MRAVGSISGGSAALSDAVRTAMYSLGIHDLQEKSRKAQEAKLRRHQSSQGQSVQRRDFVLVDLYYEWLRIVVN